MSDFTDILPSIVAQHALNEAAASAAEHAHRALHERKRPVSKSTGGVRSDVKPPPTACPGPGQRVSR